MTNFSYPKSHRLLKPDQFKAAFNQSILKVHQTHLMAFVSDAGESQPRLGMAITKKKLPTAVARNRVKRLIRERFRHTNGTLPNLDIVFILKRSTKHLTNEQINTEIDNLFSKIIEKSKRRMSKSTV